jgi:DNA-binding transcriptional MerR regulator
MLRIGEVAKRTGIGIETVRYYEKVGAITPPSRRANGYRVYTDAHVRRLFFIRRTRELGFSLEDVRSLLALSDAARPAEGQGDRAPSSRGNPFQDRRLETDRRGASTTHGRMPGQ